MKHKKELLRRLWVMPDILKLSNEPMGGRKAPWISNPHEYVPFKNFVQKGVLLNIGDLRRDPNLQNYPYACNKEPATRNQLPQ